MPRYYFDVTNAKGHYRDEHGEDLLGVEDARTQCQALLPDVAREELPGGDWHRVTCDIRDEAGRIVYRGEITYRGTRDPNGN